MTNIPPNMHIIGSIYQAQVSANKKAQAQNAQRNKRIQDSKELAKLDNQHNEEVEDTEQTDGVIVQRQDEKPRDGQDAKDTYEKHQELNAEQEKLYHSQDNNQETEKKLKINPEKSNHIDFTA